MKVPTWIRIAVLVPIIIFTHLITRHMMGQDQPTTSAQTLSGPTPPPVLGRTLITTDRLPIGVNSAHRGASAYLGPRRFEVAGRQVRVQVAVDLHNPGGDGTYMWKLKALRTEDRVKIFDVPYIDQEFPIDPTGDMTAHFDEQVSLPPGQYRLKLALLYLPTNFRWADLDDESKLETIELVSAQETVTCL